METKNLENGILELLPQIPFVVDQVGEAMQWAKEALSEGAYYSTLSTALDTAKFAAKISEANFFKTHLVIAALLNNIADVKTNERFGKFDTASKSVEQTLDKIHVATETVEERGCFKSLLIKLVPLAKEDQEAFAIMLFGILNDLKELTLGMKEVDAKAPITQKDYITVLGYSYVIANIHMANLSLLADVKAILNEISIVLSGLKY